MEIGSVELAVDSSLVRYALHQRHRRDEPLAGARIVAQHHRRLARGRAGERCARPRIVDGDEVRLRQHHPALTVVTGNRDPRGFDLVVNATPMGMNEGDELPLDVSRLSPDTFVGEVVMRTETTAFLAAARARGCRVQVGTDMLFEQIPAYLEFFGLPTTTAERLRELATLPA